MSLDTEQLFALDLPTELDPPTEGARGVWS